MEYSLNKANIDNLTGLWRLMGMAEQSGGLARSARWPYRIWLEWDQHDQYTDQDLPNRIPPGYLCPIWDAGAETAELESGLLKSGFEVGLQQLAMVLPLNTDVSNTDASTCELKILHSRAETERWSVLCGHAFGYQVDTDVIERVRLQPGVEVLWYERQGEPIATAVLYQTGTVAGVHLVGVSPEYQGQGVARALMQTLVVRAQGRGATHLFLQASAAGEPLYRSMGFVPQFSIRSYRRS